MPDTPTPPELRPKTAIEYLQIRYAEQCDALTTLRTRITELESELEEIHQSGVILTEFLTKREAHIAELEANDQRLSRLEQKLDRIIRHFENAAG